MSVMRLMASLVAHVTIGNLAVIIILMIVGVLAIMLTFAHLKPEQRRDVIKFAAVLRPRGRRGNR